MHQCQKEKLIKVSPWIIAAALSYKLQPPRPLYKKNARRKSSATRFFLGWGGGGDDATDKNRQITLKNWLITIHTFFSLCLEIRGEGGRRRRTRLTRLTRNYYTSCCCCYHTAAAAAPTAVSRVWRQDPHRPLPRSRSTSPFCCTKKRKLFSKFKQWLKKNNTFLICFLYSKIAWRIKRIGTFFGPRFEFFLCSMTLLQVSGGGGIEPQDSSMAFSSLKESKIYRSGVSQ